MTLEEAVAVLERAGLEVSVGNDSLVAAAGRREPHELVKAQGVAWISDFGFSARVIDSIWFFRYESPPKPAEQYASLDEVVARGLELFARYRAATSR